MPLVRVPEAASSAGRTADQAIDGARDFLLSIQQEDGHWCAELEGDSILESDYILLMHFVGRHDCEKARKAGNTIRAKQLGGPSGGGWAIYPGGPPEISASVKNYLVLKLLGDDPDAPHMRAARGVILRLGGIEACNSFTKIYLAIFGQYPWDRCPAVPPEIILLPNWFYFNVYEMSSWSRAIVVPLSIIWARKPFCDIPAYAHIPELLVEGSRLPVAPHNTHTARIWRRLFFALDRSLKMAEGMSLTPLRERALERAEEWILERLESSDGLGAIFPPIVNCIYAFHSLGHRVDEPLILKQLEELEKLEIEEGDTLRLQPCFSPVWDTVLTMNALLDAGTEPGSAPMQRAARWVLDREVKQAGDWQVKLPHVEPGGWYFEYANEFYPDCDDTAEALMCLSHIRFDEPELEARRKGAIERALRWQLSMQNRDGGWAAFDKGCDKEILTYVPFADHNAMIDPSTADITSRTLIALYRYGFDRSDEPVRRGLEFIRRTQEPDGSWYGRWGCNYLYGTWLALRALSAAGESPSAPAVQRATAWIRSRQNDDGGWGETYGSYVDPESKGRGHSTASQTAWGLLGLLRVGDVESNAVRRGVDHLLRTQRQDGTWRDEYWTGTGFPKVFYLRYHLYATYFPLEALGVYRALTDGRG